MYVKDLTREQIIEITKLAYHFVERINSGFEIRFCCPPLQDPNKTFIEVNFETLYNTEKEKVRLLIIQLLDIIIFIGPLNGRKLGIINNQFKIQQKFIEWGIEPNFEK